MSNDAEIDKDAVDALVVPVWLQIMIGLVALSALTMLLKYLATFGVTASGSQEVWGQFGDFFGGILNPLLSSLTLAAVLVTMRLQSKELRIAQQENKLANQHLEKQANYIRVQNFESVFFRLLEVHMSSRANVCVRNLSGKEAFDFLVRRTSDCLSVFNHDEKMSGADEESIKGFSEDFRSKVGDALNVYCRGMYQVIKYVDTYEGFSSEDAPVDNREGLSVREKMQLRREQDKAYRPIYFAKRQYINMLRAQLTQAELTMLYLSCLTEKGKGLKYLAEKYSIFKGMNDVTLTPGFSNYLYSYLAFADYEDIQIRDVRLLDALNERMSSNKKRHVSSIKTRKGYAVVFN